MAQKEAIRLSSAKLQSCTSLTGATSNPQDLVPGLVLPNTPGQELLGLKPEIPSLFHVRKKKPKIEDLFFCCFLKVV